MKKLRRHLTFANVVSCLALFVALGGASYAAFKLPKNSVGAKQLKKGAVTPAKLSTASTATLKGPAGPKGAAGADGAAGAQGLKGDPGTPATALWAVVASNGTFVRGTEGATSHERGLGEYTVKFAGHEVSECSVQATEGSTGTGPGPIGWADVSLDSKDEETVVVEAKTFQGNDGEESFHVAVFC
jgi:hypothetical protein